jgi:hypothetical protein
MCASVIKARSGKACVTPRLALKAQAARIAARRKRSRQPTRLTDPNPHGAGQGIRALGALA